MMLDMFLNRQLRTLPVFRWADKSCNDARYVLKTDDDAFVDTFHLQR